MKLPGDAFGFVEILPEVLGIRVRVGDSVLLYIIEEDSEERFPESNMKTFSPVI